MPYSDVMTICNVHTTVSQVHITFRHIFSRSYHIQTRSNMQFSEAHECKFTALSGITIGAYICIPYDKHVWPIQWKGKPLKICKLNCNNDISPLTVFAFLGEKTLLFQKLGKQHWRGKMDRCWQCNPSTEKAVEKIYCPCCTHEMNSFLSKIFKNINFFDFNQTCGTFLKVV